MSYSARGNYVFDINKKWGKEFDQSRIIVNNKAKESVIKVFRRNCVNSELFVKLLLCVCFFICTGCMLHVRRI